MSDYDDTYGEGPQEPPREVEPETEPVVVVLLYNPKEYSEQWFVDVIRPIRELAIKPVSIHVAIKDHAKAVLDVFAEEDDQG